MREFYGSKPRNEKVKRHNVAPWVEEAWAQVTVSSITNTWVSIGYKAGFL
jgi:hypothetical protein